MYTARFGGSVTINNLRETKRALKIYKDIREDPQCRLKLSEQQKMIIDKLHQIPNIIGRQMSSYKQICLDEMRSSETSLRFHDLSLTINSSGEKSSRSVKSVMGRISIHQRIKTEPLNIHTLYDTRDEIRFYVFSIVLTKVLSKLLLKQLNSAYLLLKQPKRDERADFLLLLLQLQNKGKMIIRPLERIQRKQFKDIWQQIEKTAKQSRSLILFRKFFMEASKHNLVLGIMSIKKQASINRLTSIMPEDKTFALDFINEWKSISINIWKTQRIINTLQIDLRQAFYMIKIFRKKLQLKNPTLKGRLGSIIIETETCKTIKTQSQIQTIEQSPLLQYGEILYLGAMEMLIENGEEVLVNRQIFVTQDKKLWLIKRNTRNPEELMLLKPRERSNSIEKLDVVDVVQKVMESQSTMMSSEIRANQNQKKLTKAQRSSTSKQLLSTVRPRLKPFKQQMKSDQQIIMLPPAPEYQRGTMYKLVTAKFNFLMSPQGSEDDEADESQSSGYGDVTNRRNFMRVSRSFMIQETPPMKGSIHFSISDSYKRKKLWQSVQAIQ